MSDEESNEMADLFTKITGQETVTQEQEKTDKKIRGEETDSRPTTEIQCPECENDRAYYEMKQIRAADESETRFFECTECEHKWRDDDH